MGSGSFPLWHDGKDGHKLLEAARRIEEVSNKWYESVCTGDAGGMQFDNAAYDGGFLHRLNLAARLVRECVDSQSESHPPAERCDCGVVPSSDGQAPKGKESSE